MLVVLVLCSLFGALVGISAAQRKGFSVANGVLGGLLLGVLSPLMYLVSNENQKCPQIHRSGARARLAIAMAAIVVTSLGMFYIGTKVIDARSKPPTVPIVSESSVDTPPQKPSVIARLSEMNGLNGAMSVLRGSFRDTENEPDPSAFLLAAWSNDHLTWADISAIEETIRAKVMKDPDSERGKRLCNSGTISQISVDRSAGKPIYEGGLVTPAFSVVRFLAIHSTGDLVEHSAARFCGIVTGRHSYSNAAGGFTHAVRVVGMFDLPENRKWTVSK